MTATVVFSPRAVRQAAARAAWWLEWREKAPSLFEREFAAAIAALSRTPEVGAPFPKARRNDVRRYLMLRVDHHAYYVYSKKTNTVRVLALWYSRQEHEPRL